MTVTWREEIIGDARLYLADCRDVLPTLSGIGAVVTDPPYGIAYIKGPSGRQGSYRNGPASESRNNTTVVGDTSPFDPVPLLSFDNVLMWGANHYCHRLPEGKGRWLAWNKLAALEPFDDFSDVEFAWHSKGKASRICNFMWKGGVACVKVGEENGKRYHPTQKPVGLMMWCLEQIGEADTILDPYMGSGTTGLACIRAGRRFVGVECDEGHFNTAVRRIEQAQRQGDMLNHLPPAEAPADRRMADLFVEPGP